MDDKQYIGIVDRIYPEGEHGPYVKAKSDKLGKVTFSLDPRVWREKRWPEEGEKVVLWDVTSKRVGWRANSARFFRPRDQKPKTQRREEREKR
jgi:hypothetical protein